MEGIVFDTKKISNNKSKVDEVQMNISDINNTIEMESIEINQVRKIIENNKNKNSNNDAVKNNTYFSYTSKKPVKLVENIYYFN
jgi:hypothetical protein